MPSPGIDKVTRLVALFTLLLVGALNVGGWIFHSILERGYRQASRDALREQGRLLRVVLEGHPGGPLAGWRDLESERLRLSAELDHLDLLDPEGRSLPADKAWALPAPGLPDSLLDELALGIELLPPPQREDDEIYQSLYVPLDAGGPVQAILVLEAGAAVSQQLAALRRGLWLATGAGVIFVVFVIAAMTGILQQARRRQRELDRAEHLARVGTLAAGLAHEIRNPLAIISGSAEIMEMGAGSEEERERAHDILEETERLGRLLSDFLGFARPQDLQLRTIDPREFWQQAMDEQAALHGEVSFEFQADGRLPRLQADPDRLRQVALNLLGNAAAAAGPGGRVTLALCGRGGGLQVRLRDNGPGVPAELRESIFQPFVSGREGGTGLGLAVCLSVLRAHGGDLRLTRPGPGGTEFTLFLPATGGKGAPI